MRKPTLCASLVKLLLVLAAVRPALATPPISWGPEHLVMEAVAGASTQVEVSFTSDQLLENLEVHVVPALEAAVSVAPSTIQSVGAGEVVELVVTVSIDPAESGRSFGGTIQIRHAGQPPKVYARLLPVHIAVVPREDPPPHWEVPAVLCIFNRPALGDDGVFYAAASVSCDPVVEDLGIVAIDPTDGDVLWGPAIPPGCDQHPFNGSQIAQVGVSVAGNGLLFAVGDWNRCRNGRLVAYTGAGVLFQDHGDCPGGGNTSPHPRQVPAIDDVTGAVHFGTTVLCSVDQNTILNNWSAAGGYYIGDHGIALDQVGNVYYSTYSGATLGRLRSFTSSGALRWNREFTGTHAPKIMAIVGGRLLLYYQQAGHALLAWDKDTGADIVGESWPIADLDRPVVDELGNLFASRVVGTEVMSLAFDGSVRWSTDLASEGATSAAVDFVGADGRVYARGGSSFFAISTANGGILWRFDAGAELRVPAALTPAGEIFLSDSNATIYVLDTAIEYAVSDWPVAAHGNRRHTGKAGHVLALP